MKPRFSFPVMTIAFILAAASGQAQNNPPAQVNQPGDTVKPAPADTTKTATATTAGPAVSPDKLKKKKKSKKKNEEIVGTNPYQPPVPSEKPLPYNTYRAGKKPQPETDSLGSSILRGIIESKKHN